MKKETGGIVINNKYNVYDMYFRVPLWVCGFLSLSFLTPGIFMLDAKFFLSGIIFVWGIPSVIDLIKFSKFVGRVSILILVTNIFINFMAVLYNRELLVLTIILTFSWSTICIYLVRSKEKSKK
jgi:hypothetical protein